MQTFHLATFINAPKEKVWHTMLDDATYRDWTSTFNPGSYYKGNWEQGSKMLFLGPNPEGGGEGGMVSQVRENKQYEFIGIDHLGMVTDGKEDTTSDAIKDWVGAQENYTFNEKDGGTELVIDMSIPDEYKDMMEAMWKNALVKVKELCEK